MPKLIQNIQFLFFLLFALNSYGQQTTNDSAGIKNANKKLFVNAGLQYISNLTYAGRRDESSVPILLPTFTLISKTGLFLSGIGYFDVDGRSSQAEGASITPGYVFSFDKKKEFGGAISATKYFITANSPIILSSFNASFDVQLHYNPADIVKLTIAGSYRVDRQNKNDIVNNAEFSKEIKIIKSAKFDNDGLKIIPTLTLYSGTQSFYQTYFTQSQVPRSINNPASPLDVLFPNQSPQSITQQTVTTEKQMEVKQYNPLALSGSAQLAYNFNVWQISFTPYLIKPLNQVNYISNANQNGLYFLFTAGLSATF